MRGSLEEVVEKLRRSTVQVIVDQRGGGSGILWNADGIIVTNAHVIESVGSWDSLLVQFSNGLRVPATIERRDGNSDLAFIRVQSGAVPGGCGPAPLGDASRLRVGELVVAVGSPLGFTGAVSSGVVHRLSGKSNVSEGFHNQPWIISQLRLAPGNSGGPLANAEGQVVGVNTMVADGLAFSIPTHVVEQARRHSERVWTA